VDHFAAMETDVCIRLQVPYLADTAALGDLLERILVVLDAFPPESPPGPQPGYRRALRPRDRGNQPVGLRNVQRICQSAGSVGG
jgi:hypothetical protein